MHQASNLGGLGRLPCRGPCLRNNGSWSILLKADRTFAVTRGIAGGEANKIMWEERGKAGSDDRQPLNNIQNHFLLNKRNTFPQMQVEMWFLEQLIMSLTCSFWKSRVSVAYFADSMWDQWGDSGLVVVGTVSSPVENHSGTLKGARKSVLTGRGGCEMTSSQLQHLGQEWDEWVPVLCSRNEGALSGLGSFLYFCKWLSIFANAWNLFKVVFILNTI